MLFLLMVSVLVTWLQHSEKDTNLHSDEQVTFILSIDGL